MLAHRQRRWADVVQMLYKCFVFAGSSGHGCIVVYPCEVTCSLYQQTRGIDFSSVSMILLFDFRLIFLHSDAISENLAFFACFQPENQIIYENKYSCSMLFNLLKKCYNPHSQACGGCVQFHEVRIYY